MKIHGLPPKLSFPFQGYSLPFRPEQQRKQPSNHPNNNNPPRRAGVPKGDSITPPPSNNQNTQSDKPRASQPKRHDSKPHICQGPTGNQNHPKVSPASQT